MTSKLIAAVVISQIFDRTSIVQLIQHKLAPFGVSILLRAIAIATPPATRRHELCEQEIFGISIAHIVATLQDFRVVSTTGIITVHIIGNGLAYITHQPCNSVGFGCRVAGVCRTGVLIEDIVPVGLTCRQSSCRVATRTRTRDGRQSRECSGPFPLVETHSQRRGRAASNSATATTSGALVVIRSALVPIGFYKRWNGGDGKHGSLYRLPGTCLDTVNLKFVLIEQPLHGGRNVIKVKSTFLTVHQNHRCLVITGNYYIGMIRVEDVVVHSRGLGHRGFGLNELELVHSGGIKTTGFYLFSKK